MGGTGEVSGEWKRTRRVGRGGARLLVEGEGGVHLDRESMSFFFFCCFFSEKYIHKTGQV